MSLCLCFYGQFVFVFAPMDSLSLSLLLWTVCLCLCFYGQFVFVFASMDSLSLSMFEQKSQMLKWWGNCVSLKSVQITLFSFSIRVNVIGPIGSLILFWDVSERINFDVCILCFVFSFSLFLSQCSVHKFHFLPLSFSYGQFVLVQVWGEDEMIRRPK